MASAIFIHRSVGKNLINDGNMYQLLAEKVSSLLFADYNQNNDVLTDAFGHASKMGFQFPGNDTKPADYAQLFNALAQNPYQNITDYLLKHDVIIIKSCYPNSGTATDEQLKAIKGYYDSVAAFFQSHPNKQLIILTSPPLRLLMTNPAAAHRARNLSEWLTSQEFNSNISVFNFFDLLANPPKGRRTNVLRSTYTRLLPFDSHPNANASRTIAPIFVDFLATKIAQA